MTATTATPMGPNVRRFVRSAWLLLIAQLLATGIALGATGWAAFYVADLRAERDALKAELEELTAVDAPAPAQEEMPRDEVAVIDPAPEVSDPAVFDVPPPVQRTPSQRPQAPTTRSPVSVPPRPNQQVTNSRPTQPREPATRMAPPPRRNTTYPGGLPGQGPNSYYEPPYVPNRDGGRVAVPTVPHVDVRDIVDRLPQNPPRTPNPPRTQTPPQTQGPRGTQTPQTDPYDGIRTNGPTIR